MIPALTVCLLMAAPPDEVRVSLYSIFRPTEVRVTGLGSVTLIAEDGRRSARKTDAVEVVCGGKHPVTVVSARARLGAGSVELRAAGSMKVGVPGSPARAYEGWIEISERNGLCLIVNHVAIDAYSRDVACKEIRGAGPEALRAQAVATRTYTLASAEKHPGAGFDFCDLTHCQVYIGRQACSQKDRETLQAVTGLALLHDGRPAETYYFSTCGGHTAAAADVWGPSMARDYLPGVEDGDGPNCSRSDHVRWRFEAGRQELCSRLREALPGMGKGPCSVEITAVGKGGWASRVTVRAQESVSMTGDRFHLVMGKQFGWSRFKSARFTLTAVGNRLLFRGKGLGHGVGMCQHGAMGMERAGANHRQILEHYYPGTELAPWP